MRYRRNGKICDTTFFCNSDTSLVRNVVLPFISDLMPSIFPSIDHGLTCYSRLFSFGVLLLLAFSSFRRVVHGSFFTFLSNTIRAVQRICETASYDIFGLVWRVDWSRWLRWFLRGSGCLKSVRWPIYRSVDERKSLLWLFFNFKSNAPHRGVL